MRQPTPLQQAASRSNGAKSRGPKTAAGKRRSSRNGCRHNLFSRIAPMPPADDPEFLADLADYRARYQPRTFEADSAVLSLAANMWLRMRLWPVCTEMWKAESLRQAALLPGEESRLHDAFALHHPSLQLFQRMEDRYNRRIARAFKTIEREEKLAIRAERLRLRAARSQPVAAPKNNENEVPNPTPSGTGDFSRVPPAQNDENEAPNPTPSGTGDFSRVPPAQKQRKRSTEPDTTRPVPLPGTPRRLVDFRGGEEAAIALAGPFTAEALAGISRHPRNNPQWPQVGIFAQPAKNRPNRIGSTVCRVLRVEMAEFLPREPVRQPAWPHELMRRCWLRGP